MAAALKFGFTLFARPRGVLVVFCEENLKFGPATQRALWRRSGNSLRRAAAADRFTGKSGSSLEIIAPPGLNVPRLVVVGIGKESELKSRDIVKLGGVAMGKVPTAAARRRSLRNSRSGALKANQVADLALGRAAARLHVRSLQDQAQGRRGAADKVEVNFACANPAAAEKAWARARGDRRRRRAGARSRQRAGAMCSIRASSLGAPRL